MPVVWLVSRFSTLAASTSSTSEPAIQTVRGRVATRSPTRRQKPCVSSTPACPVWGIVSSPGDQNARRPQITSAAGSTVSIEIIASATPIAPTGPSPAVEFTSARLSVSSAAITVRPEARIAGPAPRSAFAIASCSSSCLRSSSR